MGAEHWSSGMISFEEDDRGLVLLYEVENNDPEWASKRLKDGGEVTVSNGFTFESADLLKAPSKRGGEEPIYEFRFDRLRKIVCPTGRPITPRLTDPGAAKRRHLMVDRRVVTLPSGPKTT
ncbi:hypothetical protein [Bradyrhizobium sp. CCBAU 53421]|uniref:hypothetical protein n=1 Tax=Bradyrhizobium sp. CCBAU 53421 TaxID=1325120 RepID=UPI00188AC1B1|nr:hypothetical protein [Bradyrhizobium sp. CCBAU 53421]QOZ32736.1 hypothetical protein XH92_14345 [Bradyrhizobium sp. CCBAU 53421]